MSAPFWPDREMVVRTLRAAARLLLVTDYDGTLAPLAPHPSMATLPAETREILAGIARHDRIVGVVLSGRAVADVRSMIGVPGLVYAGNHGFHIFSDEFEFMEPTAAALVDSLAQIIEHLRNDVPNFSGVWIEDKGLTASVHFRCTPSEYHERIRRMVKDAVAGTAFRVTSGHMICEIRPDIDWHKGAAVRWLCARFDIPAWATVILGDDRTDEDAFQELPEATTIKVGTPAGTAARYFLDSPVEVARFLEELARPTA